MVDKNNNRDQENNNIKDLSEKARIMRTSESPEERRKAASDMGREGGKNSHGGHDSSSRSAHDVNTDLSEKARIMRTSDSPEERRKAASDMGREGGKHSHDRDNQ